MELRRYECDDLCAVESQAASEALLGEETCLQRFRWDRQRPEDGIPDEGAAFPVLGDAVS